MRRILLAILVLCSNLFAGTEPISTDTSNGHIKKTSSGTGESGKPFDWRDAAVTRLPHAVVFYVDGSGSVLTTGTKNPIKLPYGGTLKGWTLMGKPTGSVTVDIFRATSGAGLPTTSIVGSGTKPALSSAVENSSTSFTNWTSTSLMAGDNMAISLSGVSLVTYVVLVLYFQ